MKSRSLDNEFWDDKSIFFQSPVTAYCRIGCDSEAERFIHRKFGSPEFFEVRGGRVPPLVHYKIFSEDPEYCRVFAMLNDPNIRVHSLHRNYRPRYPAVVIDGIIELELLNLSCLDVTEDIKTGLLGLSDINDGSARLHQEIDRIALQPVDLLNP